MAMPCLPSRRLARCFADPRPPRAPRGAAAYLENVGARITSAIRFAAEAVAQASSGAAGRGRAAGATLADPHDRVHRPRTRAALAPRAVRGSRPVASTRSSDGRAPPRGREVGECKWEALRSSGWDYRMWDCPPGSDTGPEPKDAAARPRRSVRSRDPPVRYRTQRAGVRMAPGSD